MLTKSNLLIASGVMALLGLQAGAQMSTPTGNNNNLDYQLPQRASDYASAWQLLSDAKEPRERARAALQAVLQNLRHEAQATPERQRAVEDVSKARDAYATARDRVLVTLAKTESYVELKNKAAAIDRQIKDIHEQSRKTKPAAGGDADDARQQVLALSEERMRLGDKITAVEVDAMQAAGVEKLRDNWIAANQRLDQLQADQEARIARDPAVVAAQSRLADAELDVADARVKFVGSEAAYHAAMTLEEWQNQIRQTEASAPAVVYRDPWPYYYGNGFGIGFPIGGIIVSNGGGPQPRSMFDHDVSPINLADFTSLQPTKFGPQPQNTDSGPGSPSKPKRNN